MLRLCGTFALVWVEVTLAETQAFRGNLEKFVVFDKVDALLEA